jgi:hypothetical protein
LKIGWDVSRAFVIEAVLMMVLPPDLLYSSSDGNNNVGGLFHRFVVFLSLTATLIKFVWIIDIAFSPSMSWPTVLFSPTFGSPGARGGENARLRHSPDGRG